MSVCGCEGCGGNCTKQLELELQNKQKENEHIRNQLEETFAENENWEKIYNELVEEKEQTLKELGWLMDTFGIFGSDLERIKHIKKRYGIK